MSSKRSYFDHHASVPLGSAAKDAMRAMLSTDDLGNPSSVHAEGRAARHRVETARDQVAALLQAERDELVFTSSGSEANQHMLLAIAAEAEKRGRTRVLVSPADHPSLVRAAARCGLRVGELPIDAAGRVQRDVLAGQLAFGNDVAAIVVSWVNHELGTVQDLAALQQLAAQNGALFAVDAVQGVSRFALDVAALGIDLASVSSHKLAGPQGVGALYCRRALALPALLVGGHQERERRAGTENALGIVGFGAAAAATLRHRATTSERQRVLGERVRAGVIALGAEVSSPPDAAPGLVNFAFAGVEGALLVESLDLAGFACSTGAACSSGSVKPSTVLLAVGQDPARAKRAVRLSLGAEHADDEIERFLALVPGVVERIRASG